jgi:predicted Fe-Mo cluster-binding NifX family protein
MSGRYPTGPDGPSPVRNAKARTCPLPDRAGMRTRMRRLPQGSTVMKICFPNETNQGLKSALYGHFGSAPFFTLVESESNLVEVRDNRGQVHAHGACHPVAALEGLGVQAVVCGGMGLRALQKFEEAGIMVYQSES